MSWRHALAYVALAAVFGAALWATTAVPPLPGAVAPAALPPELDVEMVTIEVGAQRVRVARHGAEWQVLEPPGHAISAGLVERLLDAVLHSRIETVSARDENGGAFGLDQPRGRVTLQRREGPPVVLHLGSENPTATAVYGRLEGDPRVLLVGLDVWHYVSLATQ